MKFIIFDLLFDGRRRRHGVKARFNYKRNPSLSKKISNSKRYQEAKELASEKGSVFGASRADLAAYKWEYYHQLKKKR